MAAAFRSRAGVCEVEVLRGAQAAAARPVDLLLEVPHGATRGADFAALRSQLVGDYAEDLRDFFFVNTDVGAPELAHEVARRFVAACPDRVAAVVRCLLPRTFIDCNRRIDEATVPGASAAGAPTPGLPPWVQHDADRRLLLDRYAAYREVVEAGFAAVCGGGGLGLMVHTYAPRSIDVAVDDDIVASLREAYRPERIGSWPLRAPVDLITVDPEGRELVAAPVARVAEAEFAAAGLQVERNGAYNLHPITMAAAYAARYPGQTMCLELRRDLLVPEFVPFVELAVDAAKVATAAAPLAAAAMAHFAPR